MACCEATDLATIRTRNGKVALSMLRLRTLAAWFALWPAAAAAEGGKCIEVQFTPSDGLQLVAWLERADGSSFGSSYYDTLFITQKVGRYGLGNRPGRADFNSGPLWPYGRRVTTFPVWAHRNGKRFPVVLFQNDTSEDPEYCLGLSGADGYQSCAENNLSHPLLQSSRELLYCRPIIPTEAAWDAGTCATMAYTDKGRFSSDATKTTGYPPRVDIARDVRDSPSVDSFKAMNPFDAVSQPTPAGGAATRVPWAAPVDLPDGDYVLYVEAAKEFDFNAAFGPTQFPSPPGIPWSEYGKPYRGQPSVIYRVPFSIGSGSSSASTPTYFGHGDPRGASGAITPASPIDQITTDTPGSGASRLQLVSDTGTMYRVRVKVQANAAAEAPAAPADVRPVQIGAGNVTVSFVAPGVGETLTRATGYQIRIRANDELTAANFLESMPIATQVTPDDPGREQSFDIAGLLPETEYWIGIRAFSGCRNYGELAIVKIATAPRMAGEVDACFVATAAYGSAMANDVDLLRHARDVLLETTVLGELGVEFYYTFGPAIAAVIRESDLLRATARGALAPIVARVRQLAF